MKRYKELFIIMFILVFFACNFSYTSAENNTGDYKYSSLPDAFYFYRNILSEKKQTVYDEIYSGLCNAADEIRFSTSVSYDEIQIIAKAVMYDHPEIIWFAGTYSVGTINNTDIVVYMYPDYNDLVEHRIEALEQIDKELSKVFDILNTLDSDIEIVKYVHDYLIHTVDYSLDSDYNQTMYSAVIEKKSVCSGYSHTVQYILEKMGIPCTFVIGKSFEEFHAWNLLRLDDDYYALDVTWDDPIWVDEQGNIIPDYEFYIYTYFNVTDQELGEDHKRDEISSRIPIAEGTKYSFKNYYKNNNNNRGTDFDKKGMVVPKVTAMEYANAVKLHWEMVDNADGYIIYQNIDGKYIETGRAKSTEYTIYELDNNRDYSYAIKAYKLQNNKMVYSGKYKEIDVSTNGNEDIYKNEESTEINDTTDYVTEEVSTKEIESPEFQTTVSEKNASGIETVPKETKPTSNNNKVEKPAKVRIKKLSLKRRRLIIQWTNGKKGVIGYQVQLSQSKKFQKKSTYTIKKRNKVNFKSKRIKKGETYFVRVRTYCLVNSKRIYSDWSEIKKKKIK